MTYLLDTNTIVRYLNGRAPNVQVRLSAVPLAELAVSAIVVAELRYGAAKSLNPAKAVAAQDQLLSLNMTLVTHNTSEFSRVAGLLLDDWE